MAKRRTTPKHVRLPNGFGNISEIKNKNLRKPFRATLTVGKNKEGRLIRKILGYYEDWYSAYDALSEYHKNPYELNKDTLTVDALYQKWSESYFAELKSESSVRTITSAWEYVPDSFKRLNASVVKAQTVKDMILFDAKRENKYGKYISASPNMQSRIKSALNLMYDYAVLAGIVEINPVRQFTLKGIQGEIENKRENKTPFTEVREQELWNDLEFSCTRMILINVYTAWRPKELIELKKRNVNLEEMTMIGGMKTKAGTNRVVPIHSRIRELVQYYYDKSDGEYLFYDYDNAKVVPFTYDTYRRRFEKVMARHGWNKEYSSSCPRHTFSTKAKERRMEELARKRIMGHEIVDVTDKHYTHMDLIKYLAEEIEKI